MYNFTNNDICGYTFVCFCTSMADKLATRTLIMLMLLIYRKRFGDFVQAYLEEMIENSVAG